MFKMCKQQLTLPLLLSAPLFVAGCGGSGQDVGEASTSHNTVSGRAIDGYLARATVFHDTNNNGRRDAWEAFAFTDDHGYFTYNPLTGTDYCADDAPAELAQYCLRLGGTAEAEIIRIGRGYDLLTGEPFLGQLSRRLGPGESELGMLVTPLTTLVSHAKTEEERATLLDILSLDESDLQVDYLNSDGASGVDARLLNAAVKIHKTVTVLSEQIRHTYTAIGDEPNTPNDASAWVYGGLARSLMQNGGGMQNPLVSAEILRDALGKAEQDANELYERNDLAPEMGLSPQQQAQIAAQAATLATVIDTLIDRHETGYTQADAKGRASAAEIVTLRASAKSDGSGQEFLDTAAFFTAPGNEELIAAITSVLGGHTGDLANLMQHDFQYMTSPEEITALAQTDDRAQPFAQLSGASLRVSDPNLGHAPNAMQDSEVELYFQGEPDATNGALKACVKYIDDASQDGTLGEGSTRGELVSGYWSLLGATMDNPESRNLVLTLDFLGARYQAILKSAGQEMVDGKLQHKLRFDHQNEISTWYSETGLQPVAHVPSSSAQCRERLPSRIGL